MKKKLFKKILIIALGIIILGGIIAGGIYYYQSRKTKVVENNKNSVSTGIDTTNWKIYRDLIEGYSFKYPLVTKLFIIKRKLIFLISRRPSPF